MQHTDMYCCAGDGRSASGHANGCQPATAAAYGTSGQPQQQQWQEWEDDISAPEVAAGDGEPTLALAPLFAGDQAGAPEDELVDEQLELPGFAHALRLQSVSRAQRHTLAHTGLMLWEAAPVLSRLLLRCPSLVAGAQRQKWHLLCVQVCMMLRNAPCPRNCPDQAYPADSECYTPKQYIQVARSTITWRTYVSWYFPLLLQGRRCWNWAAEQVPWCPWQRCGTAA